MNQANSQEPEVQSSLAGNSSRELPPGGGELIKMDAPATHSKDGDPLIVQAQTRIDQAEARTERAEARTEQAEIRTERAETRIEQAETRIEQAEARTEQARTRTEQAETRTEQAESRIEEAESRIEQAEALSEQAIGASELSYRRLFEAAKDGILILDAESGQITDVNPFLVALLGFAKAEVLGKTVAELSPFKDIESNEAMLKQLQQHGYVRYDDLPLETREGLKIAVEFVSNVYQAGNKKVIQCNIRDITERKRTEAQLLASVKEIGNLHTALDEQAASSRLAAIVESSNDAIVGKDLSGIITSWNQGAEKIFGFSADEMIGTSIMRLVPADRQSEEDQMMERIKRGEKVEHYDSLRQTKGGPLIAVSVTVSAIKDAAGKVIGISKVARDITERKAAEEVRLLNLDLERLVAERTAQLQFANHELQAFSYSVAHDLRAPLRHVLGFVAMLKDEAGPTLSEGSLRHLAVISESSKRMGMLIDDLLSFSRLGQSEMHKSDVNLDELVHGALADFQAETAGRKVIWQIGALPGVWADRSLLRMVLVNLISNAVKFTGSRAEARIEIGSVPGADTETVIFIRDNGAGFDQKYSAKLFGVFQRLHSQAEFEGTGIGLANIQRIIHRHGGRVWAEGVVGSGATFYFSIPRKPAGS